MGKSETSNNGAEECILKSKVIQQSSLPVTPQLQVSRYSEAARQLDNQCQVISKSIAIGTLSLYWTFLWCLCAYVGNSYVSDTTSFLLKFIAMGLPLYHHWHYKGISYRRLRVFVVALSILVRVKLIRSRAARASSAVDVDEEINDEDHEVERIWEDEYEIASRLLYTNICRFGGLWTKIAQFLSSRSDVCPDAYVRELSKLLDKAPATPWPTVKAILESEGVYHQLMDIEQTPIASASIAQVHVARLAKPGGSDKVAVKVQHPFVRRLLLDDFWSLSVIARIATILLPNLKVLETILNEWAKESRHELDFSSELENLRTAHEAAQAFAHRTTSPLLQPLKGTKPTKSLPLHSIPFTLEVPQPYPELCTRNVLVMSFSEGKRVDDEEHLRQNNIRKEDVMEAICHSFAYLMFVSPIFNADPHPANVFVRRNNDDESFTLVILDWGLAKRLPENQRKGLCQLGYAAATCDYGLLLDGFATIGLPMDCLDVVAEDLQNIRYQLRDMASQTKARQAVKKNKHLEKGRRQQKGKGKGMLIASQLYMGEIYLFLRTNQVLRGIASRLETTAPSLHIFRPYTAFALQLLQQNAEAQGRQHQNQQLRPLDTRAVHSHFAVKLQSFLRQLDEEGKIAGVQVCVVNHSGDVVVDAAVGHMGSTKSHLPMTNDALLVGFSNTKGIVSTLTHIMVQQGYLDYDEALCERAWPNFCPFEVPPEDLRLRQPPVDNLEQRWQWKRAITLRHILSHTAGLAHELPPSSLLTYANCEECMKSYEYSGEDTLLPMNAPAVACKYHYVSYGWLLAGALTNAYQVRHGKEVTLRELYTEFLKPKLPDTVLDSGFLPFGGLDHGDPKRALTQLDPEQLQQALNVLTPRTEEREKTPHARQSRGAAMEKLEYLIQKYRGREYLLDPRIWNCSVFGADSNVPAACGRFSATAMAHFYHALGNGKILDGQDSFWEKQVLSKITMTKDDWRDDMCFGLGYQVVDFGGERFVGQCGMFGSMGLFHPKSGTSLSVMANMDGTDIFRDKILELFVEYVKSSL